MSVHARYMAHKRVGSGQEALPCISLRWSTPCSVAIPWALSALIPR